MIPPDTRQAALEDYISGLTCAQTAERHGVSVATVGKWIQAAGVSRLTTGKPRTEEDEVALTGGQWVARGGIKVWQPDAKPAPLRSVGELIACPTCRATVSQSCRTASGHTTAAHDSRLAPRLCPCGARVDHRKRLCDFCRIESTRASKADHARRRRSETAA